MEVKNRDKYVTPQDECLKNITTVPEVMHCIGTWDTITCWQTTPAGQITKQICPPIFGAEPDHFVYKTCRKDGTWDTPAIWKGFGYSDYTDCLKHLPIHVPKESSTTHVVDDAPEVHETICILSISLLTISLILLLLSVVVFTFLLPKSVYRAVQCKMARNLFLSMILLVMTSLVQHIVNIIAVEKDTHGRLNIPIFCEIQLSVNQYAEMTVLMWLFLSVHLLMIITRSGRLCTSGYMTYIVIGWGLPAVPTVVWIVTLTVSHKVPCWHGYETLQVMWIQESSKLLILLGTSVFLAISTYKFKTNLEILTKCGCFDRIKHDMIKSFAFFGYITACFVVFLIYSHVELSGNSSWEYTMAVLMTSRGTILSILYIGLNPDVQKRLRLRVKSRRQSSQHLVRTTEDDHVV